MTSTPATGRMLREQQAAHDRGERDHPLASWANSAEETHQSHIAAEDLYAAVLDTDQPYVEPADPRTTKIPADYGKERLTGMPNRKMRRHPRG